MTLDECLKNNGTYELIECKKHMSEFQLVVKDGEYALYELIISPSFAKKMLNEKKDFSLTCDLHEDEGWELET